MSLRDLLICLFIVGSIPTCFRRPFIGLLIFTLLAYMRLQDLSWGFARYQRWSYYIAIVTIAGFVCSSGQKRFMLNDLRCWIMVALIALVGISWITSSTRMPYDLSIYIEFCKIIGVALFTTGVVKNRDSLRILVWVIALSFGFFGLKGGIQWLLSGGSMVIIEGPGGMLSDNNDFALALCMGIPLLFHLGMAEARPILRRTLIAMVPLTMLTVIATHSRGAFLSMGMVAMVLIWRSQNRLAGFATGILLAIAFAIAVPQAYLDRLSTIQNYESEGSARGRLDAWAVAANMIQHNPLLGVGFEQFQRNYQKYDPKATVDGRMGSGTRVTHNSYLQIWAECGTPVFVLYMTLILLTFLDLWKIRREAKRLYRSSWILSYATMFEASLVAFCTGAMFLNRANFDLFYHLVAIVVVFGRVARATMRGEVAEPKESTGRGTLREVQEHGFGRRPQRNGFDRRPVVPGFKRQPALGGF